MPEYTYYCPMRPPTLGAVPKEGLQYIESFTRRKFVNDIMGLAWGYAVYNRQLAEDEIEQYELIEKQKEQESV